MARLVVQDLDAALEARLQARARKQGRSVEDEVHALLRRAMEPEPDPAAPLGQRLRALFADCGMDHDFEERHGQAARPADFSE